MLVHCLCWDFVGENGPQIAVNTIIADSQLHIVPQRLALEASLSWHRQQRHSYVRNRRQSLPAPLTHNLLPGTNPSQLDRNVHHQMEFLDQTATRSAFICLANLQRHLPPGRRYGTWEAS